MSKLVVTLLVCVLIAGATIYSIGHLIAPATGIAGITQRNNIQNAFQ